MGRFWDRFVPGVYIAAFVAEFITACVYADGA
jgi:hypothetical protein